MAMQLRAAGVANPRSTARRGRAYRAAQGLARRVELPPDGVWQAGGSAVAVIDAKYKAGKVPNADLYQLLTYCTVLALRVGQAGASMPAEHMVRQAGITISAMR